MASVDVLVCLAVRSADALMVPVRRRVVGLLEDDDTRCSSVIITLVPTCMAEAFRDVDFNASTTPGFEGNAAGISDIGRLGRVADGLPGMRASCAGVTALEASIMYMDGGLVPRSAGVGDVTCEVRGVRVSVVPAVAAGVIISDKLIPETFEDKPPGVRTDFRATMTRLVLASSSLSELLRLHVCGGSVVRMPSTSTWPGSLMLELTLGVRECIPELDGLICNERCPSSECEILTASVSVREISLTRRCG